MKNKRLVDENNQQVDKFNVPDGCENEDLIAYDEDSDCFHIGQSYSLNPCDKLVCSKCGCDKFFGGDSDYFTALKCPTCGWEICLHDG